MRLVIINHNAGSIYHGPNLRTYYAANELVNKHGHDVIIVSSSYSHKYSVLPDTKYQLTDEIIDGIKYKWIKCIKYKNLFQRIFSHFQFGIKLLFYRKRICTNADLIIFSCPPPEIFLFAYWFSKLLKSPIISDIRDIWPLTQIEMSKVYLLNPYTYFLYIAQFFMIKKSNLLVSPLPGVKSYYRKASSKIDIIENGFDLERPISSNELFLSRHQDQEPGYSGVMEPISIEKLRTSGKFIIGYTGSFDRDNDLESISDAAKAFRDNPDIIFLFVGDGIKKDKLVELAKQQSNILVCERVTSEFVPRILDICDICYCGLKPKKIYNYGVSLAKSFEYMASKKPIIWMIDAYNNPVKDSGCGFIVEPGDVEKLKNTISEAFCMKTEKLHAMGKLGYKYLLKNNSYHVLGEKWNRLISRLNDKV